jgi:hypothetical protein
MQPSIFLMTLAVAGAALWPGSAVPQALMMPSPSIEDEPNADADHASWIDLPLVDGAACIDPAGELDYYQFSLETAGSLVIGVAETPVPGFGSQPLTGGPFRLSLFDEQQHLLAVGADALEVPMLASGTYLLSITHVQKACYLLNVYAGSRH